MTDLSIIPVVKEHDVDYNTWEDIPTMAKRLGVDKMILARAMSGTGLRKRICYSDKTIFDYEPTKLAVDNGLIIRVEVKNKNTVMFRWNYLKLFRFLNLLED